VQHIEQPYLMASALALIGHWCWRAAIGSLICLFLSVTGSFAAEPVATGARVSGDTSRTRFVADVTEAVSYSVYVLPDPFRVIIDLPNVKFNLPPGIGRKTQGLIAEYRYGSMEEGHARIVLDTSGPVLIEKSYIVKPTAGQPARVIVDLISTDRKTFEKTYASDEEKTKRPVADAEPQPFKELGTLPEPSAPAPRSKPITGLPKDSKQAEAPRESGRRRVVVIDPGHGGIDPGAISVRDEKIREKDVVLEFGLALRDALKATGKFDVVMTRDNDRFITLKDRVRIARQHQGDLFVAIHADTVRGQSARGATVYTLSEKASDAEAQALADKENRADIINGVDLGAESEEVNDILFDLVRRETKNHSLYFAKRTVAELKSVTQMTGRPARSAGFLVLRAPDVPSILLEIGYLSSKADVALLTSKKWQQKTVQALTRAVEKYFLTEIAQRR
jgi:N-acetylmuramoyl-L-alanine amidase